MTTEEKNKKQLELDKLRKEFDDMTKAKTNGEYYNNEPVSPHRIQQLRREIWALEDAVQQGVTDAPDTEERKALDLNTRENLNKAEDTKDSKDTNGVQTPAVETRDNKELGIEIVKLQNEKTEALKEIARLATENEKLAAENAKLTKRTPAQKTGLKTATKKKAAKKKK